MPAAAAAYLFQAGASALGASAFAASVIGAGAGLLVASVQSRRVQKKAESDQRNAYEASLQDRTTVIRSPIVPRNIVFGRDRMSGPLLTWFTWGSISQFHTFAVVLAGHECDAIEQYYFNEEPVTLDQNGWVTTSKYVRRRIEVRSERLTFDGSGVATTGATPYLPAESSITTRLSILVPNGGIEPVNGGVIDAWYGAESIAGNTITQPAVAGQSNIAVNYNTEVVEPLFRIWTYLGAPGQQASPELIAAASAAGTPSSWDANRRGTSVCYCVVQMEADFDILGQIGVPNISAVGRGVKALDTRTGLTQWTQNPAMLARWFLVDSIYSPTTISAEVGQDELEAGANVCDETISLSSSVSGPRYVANGQLSSATIPRENLARMLDAMDGDAVWVSGAWRITAGYYRVPTLTIDESGASDADVRIAPYAPKDKLFNLVSGTFVSPADGYTRTSYPAVTVPAYVADDNGESLPAQMDFDLVADAVRCQMIAWQRLTRARQQLTIQFGANLKGYDTWPTENVNLLFREFFGGEPKVHSIQRREFDGNRLLYVAQETGPEVWDWDYADAQQAIEIPNTSLPDPFTLEPPTIISAESGDSQLLIGTDGSITSRIRIETSGTTNPYVVNGGFLETQYSLAIDEQWQAGPSQPGAETGFWILPVQDGQGYRVRARYRNSSGRLSAWSLAALHTVVGKLEPPPAVTGVALSTDRVFFTELTKEQIKDLAGYQARAIPGTNPQWSLGVSLHEGLITDSPWQILRSLYGLNTIMVAAVDTTGNVGPIEAGSFATQDFGSPDTTNAIQQYDYGANGWPGFITNATAGVTLQADLNPSSDFWSIGQDFWVRDNAQDFWGGSSYLDMIYIAQFTPLYGGGLILLELEATGSLVTIEFRVNGATVGDFWDGNGGSGSATDFWSGDSFWGESEWQPWIGSAVSVKNRGIQWRVSIAGGPQQGEIIEMIASLVLELVSQVFQTMTIDAGGERLDPALGIPARQWVEITSVTANPINDGSGATGVRILDLSDPVLGPEIELVNSSGNAVTGTAPPVVYGFADIE